jgi:hypothetical protein
MVRVVYCVTPVLSSYALHAPGTEPVSIESSKNHWAVGALMVAIEKMQARLTATARRDLSSVRHL